MWEDMKQDVRVHIQMLGLSSSEDWAPMPWWKDSIIKDFGVEMRPYHNEFCSKITKNNATWWLNLGNYGSV